MAAVSVTTIAATITLTTTATAIITVTPTAAKATTRKSSPRITYFLQPQQQQEQQ
jgi:hypothetical protein